MPEPVPPIPTRLLVVDDDATLLDTLRDALEIEGFSVQQAHNLEEAAAVLATQPVDLVLTDLFGIGFHDSSFARVGEFWAGVRAAPIIVMTGFAEAQRINPATYGLAGVLLKPFGVDELVGSIHQALPTRASDDSGRGSIEPSLGATRPDGTPRGEVLVVDDDPDIREAVGRALEAEGYAVATARNGAEALAIVERELPDLVLLDMRMPVMDGWAFARAVEERSLPLVICVMTAATDAQVRAREINAAYVLSKPFDLEELLAVVERARR
ncbi:MAG: hypothetical protein QOF51_2702 [Chloroflexota bacterium]|jgi:DNA-binding response OmpR family regulator|nr:hypothetical protein [Chloroflexota bacterium]